MTSGAAHPLLARSGLPGGITVHARDWGWRHAGRKAWALRGVSFTLAPGERVLLLGASGSGKSTLLAGLAGLLEPGPDGIGDQAGELLLNGMPAVEARRAAVVGAGIGTGLLLQDPQAQTVLARCGDDVAFGLENHAVPADRIWPRVRDALAGVGFEYPLRHPTAALSGGERQRLALAGVLALRPGLLLLDEPTAMLDPDGADRLRAEVSAVLAEAGLGLLLVEHRIEPWLPLVDRVLVLQPGAGVVADGPPGELLADPTGRLAAAGIWLPGRGPEVAAAQPAGRPGGPGPRSRPATGRADPAMQDWAAMQDPPVGQESAAGQDPQAGQDQAAGQEPAAGQDPARKDVATVPLLAARDLAVHRPGREQQGRDQRGDRPPGGPPPDHLLVGVDLELRAGRTLAVTGPNGAGKTTLGLVLAGLLPPAGGNLDPAPELAAAATGPPDRWPARQLVTRIGTVFQDPQHQFVAGTVEAELEVGPRRAGLPETEIRVRTGELLRRLRLEHLARANPFTLSGGEQRRLSVGTALATRPRILVLDEPTFGQDALTWGELVGLLRELVAAGTALLVITHDQDLVRALTADGRGDELRLPGPSAVPGMPASPQLAAASMPASPTSEAPTTPASPTRAAPTTPASRERSAGSGPRGQPGQLDPLRPDPDHPAARRALIGSANPIAKLLAALAVPLALVLSVDVVSAGVALVLELLALPWVGVGPRGLLRRGWVLLLGALPAGVLTALFGAAGGSHPLLDAGPVQVSAGSLQAALAVLLRILAIGLPGVVLVATTDPTDLADALGQVARLPARFVLSALAALRLLGVLVEEWRLLRLARRARGLGDGWAGRLSDVPSLTFAILVLALRRATVLATAMEARGFGVRAQRSWARPSRLTRRDLAVAAGGLLLPAVAVAVSIGTGAWNPVLS